MYKVGQSYLNIDNSIKKCCTTSTQILNETLNKILHKTLYIGLYKLYIVQCCTTFIEKVVQLHFKYLQLKLYGAS